MPKQEFENKLFNFLKSKRRSHNGNWSIVKAKNEHQKLVVDHYCICSFFKKKTTFLPELQFSKHNVRN